MGDALATDLRDQRIRHERPGQVQAPARQQRPQDVLLGEIEAV